jgi:hypothetical protein
LDQKNVRRITLIDLLCAGTGRDGTVTMTNLINQIFDFENKNKTCGHEIFSRMIFNRLHELGYGGLCLDNEIASLIKNCEFSAVVGSGYGVVLDLFSKINPQCKLIHLKRKNKQAFIESFTNLVSQFPHLVGGYSDTDESRVDSHIMTAVDFKEMSVVDWNLLSTSEKISWYYNKTHQLIETHKYLFADYKIIYTEELDEEKIRKELTKYVLSTNQTDYIPSLTHLNTFLFQNCHCSPQEKSILQWWLHDLNPYDVLKNDNYILDFIINKYTALIGYHSDSKVKELFGLDSKPKDDIKKSLDKANTILVTSTDILRGIKNNIILEEIKSGKLKGQFIPSNKIFGIKIIEATYGWNCRNQESANIHPGNITTALQKKCDGKEFIKFKIDVNELGDPAPGLEKDMAITWRHIEDPMMTPHYIYIPAEAHGMFVEISTITPNPDQPEPRCGYSTQVENTSMGPGPRRVL